MSASKKLPFTKDELKWARKQAKLLGVKDGPEAFLEMRWSEVSRLAAEKGLDWVIQDLPELKKNPSTPARRPKSKKRPARK